MAYVPGGDDPRPVGVVVVVRSPPTDEHADAGLLNSLEVKMLQLLNSGRA